VNGRRVGESCGYVFDTEDPGITIDIESLKAAGFPGAADDVIEVEWEISILGKDMAGAFESAKRTKRRFWH